MKKNHTTKSEPLARKKLPPYPSAYTAPAKAEPSRRKGRMRFWIPITILLLAFFTAALWPFLHTVRYTVPSGKISEPLTIVAVSDLHSDPPHWNDLAADIRRENPDVVFLVGDIVDDRKPSDDVDEFLRSIAGVCPIYYVTGNHEYRSRQVEEYCDLLESHGVAVLRDEVESITVKGNLLHIAGLEDSGREQYALGYDWETAMAEAFSGLEEQEGYKILLAHRPEWIEEYKAYPFDLVFSGHAHGGQIRFPYLLNGIYAPNQGLFPEYAGGIFTHGELTHVVSRGISNYGLYLPRVFNPPELVVVRVEPD